MKSILCYGDSNTFGHIPETGLRFGRGVRWPGVMQNILGGEYHVIEEGLCGRTTVWEDPIEEHKCGKSYLIPCLESHKPLDLVLLMLGTNDLKHRFGLNGEDIARGAEYLVQKILASACGPDRSGPPQVLLICPPPIARETQWPGMFASGHEKSLRLAPLYAEIARQNGVHFFDAGGIISVDPADGVHFSAASHKKLGKTLARTVLAILP